MKSTLLLLTTALLSSTALAQAPAPQSQPDPVEETEATEDENLRPLTGQDTLPEQSPEDGPTGESIAAEDDEEDWDVNAPPGVPITQVPIRTSEGTWVDVDVSPDGRLVAFNVLGDIYTIPIDGGTPTRIAEGLAWEVQPRFSPDGTRIAFTSDRGGGDNIWIMNVDGSDKRQLTKEDFRLVHQPTWSPDGQFIAAKKHFTTGRSLGTGEVWLYHVSGGSGVALVERPNPQHQKELGEPIYAPDGNAIYYTRNVTPGPIFEYAQDSNTELFNIERYDLTSGETTTAVGGLGGAVRPTPSPDGTKIAFVRRENTRSKLYVRDLESGAERKIYDDLDQDVQETWAVTGVYPNMDWTPDSQSIVFWAGGKIWRVDADGSNAREIPFAIDDTRGLADAPHPVIPVQQASVEVTMPRFAEVSPDGRTVVFESLGRLYTMPAGGGTMRRLTSSQDGMELYPSWSRDGSRIAFVRWTDDGLGQIRTVGANGRGERAVTDRPGHYARPEFSPDGSTIVFERGTGGYLTAPEYSDNPGVYRVAASGGAQTLVSRSGSNPHFGAASDRIFMTASQDGSQQLVSVDLNGEARRVHASGELVTGYAVSPSGKFFAFTENFDAFAMPLMPGGQSVTISAGAKNLPVVELSDSAADYVHWSSGGERVHWSLGPTLYTATLGALFPSAPPAEGEDRPAYQPPQTGVSMLRTEPAAIATGSLAITGAKVVTMADDDGGIVENATILVQDGRIAAIGPTAAMTYPAGTPTIDARGKTILPGFIDAHAHGPTGDGELVPEQNWSLIQNLALGTTTIHDPSSGSTFFVAEDLQRTGRLLAPRLFSTGRIIYGARAPGAYAQIDTLEDALDHVRRLKAEGAPSVKNYNQPRREQRQMVVEAARRENMLVVAEGGSLFGMDLNLIADGNSTLEHNIPVMRIYDDVLQFFGQSDTNYTPTLVVGYGGLAGDPYWRQATDVFAQPLLQAHTPPAILRAGNARRTTAPEGDFIDDDVAREAKRIADTGVLVSIGAHGQQAGIGTHWEIWSFVRGGMSELEALQAATIVPAKSLGMDREIGSLEPGKLADLVILDGDPLENIRNTERVDTVVLGGRAYDAATMNEIVTGDAQRAPYWWE
ncbi:amidohydrolase family protein [Alteriqipengyuania lutimaris]|uniref:Amidohydrolase n=1 Tax=Alteriqipengyuania lutimaris TaxID=1538146 RepID=A0A395LMM7_9SPHN|nr:amidohydrolase family protein [Alteriqipengyuania lutimaris]MBB3032612.1 imidazolonepropionase-like amidohydrolase/Tol biopolymer transport system component [Alteriqipengyuania lutimaris]RDS78268.1 amidohydrolase [Alteriqipengyuania lutimaris]